MPLFLSANFANTTLASGLTSGGTIITVASGTGAQFPSPTGGNYFTVTLNDALTGLVYEICNCTSRTGDNLTVTRGQQGTSARAWLIGDFAYRFLTAEEEQNTIQVGSAAGGSLSGTYPNPSLSPNYVQNGTGVEQDGNQIKIGWDGSTVRVTVDISDEGSIAFQAAVTAEINTETVRAEAQEAAILAQCNPGRYLGLVVGQGTPGTYSYTVPANVFYLRWLLVGGGGGGSNCQNTSTVPGAADQSGGGGGGGAYAEVEFAVTAGQVYGYSVGAGGGTQNAGGSSQCNTPSGTVVAGGGGGASFQSTGFSAGGVGGICSGPATRATNGSYGSDGQADQLIFAGNGGSSAGGGGGGRAGNHGGIGGQFPGGGGGGAYSASADSTAYTGGVGSAGAVYILGFSGL
jgi:hypothetical protein